MLRDNLNYSRNIKDYLSDSLSFGTMGIGSQHLLIYLNKYFSNGAQG
jgi:hypothetical protein